MLKLCDYRPVASTKDDALEFGRLIADSKNKGLDPGKDPACEALYRKLNPDWFRNCDCPIYRGILCCAVAKGAVELRAKRFQATIVAAVIVGIGYRPEPMKLLIHSTENLESALDSAWPQIYEAVRHYPRTLGPYRSVDGIPWEIHNISDATDRKNAVEQYLNEKLP